eukprot:m.546367 g.546367  ORF g.546367 m.546367 type:complete len:51 (+) comp22152_c1_seq2:1507-1659(+)
METHGNAVFEQAAAPLQAPTDTQTRKIASDATDSFVHRLQTNTFFLGFMA